MKGKRLNTEEFVARARKIHGDKYDYSKVVYVNMTTPVCISCMEHGDFYQLPHSHLVVKSGCPSCGKSISIKKLKPNVPIGKDEFVKRSRMLHGDKYDYSRVEYVNLVTEVEIICPIHGSFLQKPSNHLDGCGCQECGRLSVIEKSKGKPRNRKEILYGVANNDYNGIVKTENKEIQSYTCWCNMLKRCYDAKCLEKEPSYKECSVCDEWLKFSNFKEWFDKNYIDGYELDKDILFKHNKIYSPETCCFVPQFLNTLLINVRKIRGQYPIGIRRVPSGRFVARVSYVGKRKHLGTFDTIEEAFAAYKKEKESYIKEVAQKYFNDGKITKRVYDALIRYEVEITD